MGRNKAKKSSNSANVATAILCATLIAMLLVGVVILLVNRIDLKQSSQQAPAPQEQSDVNIRPVLAVEPAKNSNNTKFRQAKRRRVSRTKNSRSAGSGVSASGTRLTR